MNRELQLISTVGMSQTDWLKYRHSGIGASEVPTVVGLNQYKCPHQLWDEKVYQAPQMNIENIAMFGGKRGEDLVADDYWPYWDGSEESVIKNYNEGRIMRRCQRVNAFVRNPKFPWLFVSLDRKINSHNGRGEGALEIKNIAGYERKKWEFNVPPGFIFQLNTQELVCEFLYGELAILEDGRYFDVLPMDISRTICDGILEHTEPFWNSILKARTVVTQQYVAKKEHNMRRYEELQAELVTLEPPPDSSEAYEKYLKDKFKKSMAEVGVIKGSADEFAKAKEIETIKAKIKVLEDEKRLYENELKHRIGTGKVLDFGKQGRVSWAGEPRKFIVNLKP